jgi:alginate biosynthesis protein AlgX
MKNFYASLAIAIALITAGTISGYIASSGRAGELDEFFCSGLKQEKSYEKYNLEHYKILIEGRDGWIFRTENDFRKDFTVNDVTGRYLTKIQNVLERKDIELVIIYPPVRGMVHADKVKGSYRKQFALNHLDEIWSSYEKMIAGLKKSGIGIIGLDRQEVTDDFFYKRNHHWSASGANITAKKVADYVERLPIYKSLPKQTYRT